MELYPEYNHSSLDHALGSDSVVVLPKSYNDLLHNHHQRLIRCPQYRNSRTGGASRSTRTQIDHDVFEGLPVRHWRKKPISVTTAPEKENMNDMKARNLAWPELEMPRDSHLLSEMSQNLLRAARMPQAKKSIIAPSLEDDKEPGEDEDADGELDTGFIAKRWAVVPKDLEGPEPEFLAKRRKGLPSIHGGAMAALGTTQRMRKTKIRKLDATGENSVLEVLVPEGQSIDGEIFEEETSPTQAPAPGTVVEGIGVVNAEGMVIAGDQGVPTNNRRRPPPPKPKRKPKGPGRGKKKRVAFVGADGRPTSQENMEMSNGATGSEREQMANGGQRVSDQARAMGDESTSLQEGEEGSEEGSEGEEGEEGDREEGELSPSPSPLTSSPKFTETVTLEAGVGDETELSADLRLPPVVPVMTGTESTTTVEPSILPTIGPVIEPDQEPNEKPAAEASDHNHDEMQLDEPIAQPILESTNHSVVQSTTQPAADALLEPAMKISADTVSQSGGEVSEVPTEEPDVTPEPVAELVSEPPSKPTRTPSPEKITTDLTESTSQEQPNEMTPNPTQEPEAERTADMIQEPDTQEIPEKKPEAMLDLPGEMIQEAAMDASPEALAEPVSESIPAQAVEVPPATAPAVPGSDFSATDETAIEPTPDLPVDVSAQHREKSAEKDIPEPQPKSVPETLPGLMVQPAPLVTMETVPVLEPQTVNEPVRVPVEDTSPPEPSVLRVAEVYYEPPVEPAERRFSFTRPTASPKAPTPSPPTPMEDKISLRAGSGWVSPKAPTMSPPTPLDRSLPSSPDIPLAEQQFALPPPIDAAHMGIPADVPDANQIPIANRIHVEAAPEAEPQVNAQIPVEHDPLDGLAEPKVAHDTRGESDLEGHTVQFSDGEEDLLGSLERSLG